MNYLSKALLGLLLCLTAANSYAQQDSPDIYKFSKLPEETFISKSTLASAFDYQNGDKAIIRLTDQLSIEGVVINNEKKYDNLQNIIIRTEDNVVLSLSKQTENGKEVKFTGRILGKTVADGFSIQRVEENYVLKKFTKSNILQDCNF